MWFCKIYKQPGEMKSHYLYFANVDTHTPTSATQLVNNIYVGWCI